MAETGGLIGTHERPPFSAQWFAELRRSLAVMARVIHAVILREARTRYGSSNLGYIWGLVDPFIQLVIFVAIFSLLGRTSPVPAPMQVFFATGIIPLLFWRGSVSQATTAVSASLGLLTYPQVMPADVVLARLLLEAATTLIVATLFVLGLHFIADISPSFFLGDPLGLLAALTALFFFALGTSFLSSSLGRIIPMWRNIWSYMGRPIYLMSGIFWTLEQLPPTLRQYMAYNPVAHMVEWVRSAAIPTFESDAYSVVYPMIFAAGALLIGLVIDRILIMTGDEEIVS